MPGQLSQYLETELIRISLGLASTTLGLAAPTNLVGNWLALYTVSPTDTTSGTEVSGAGYARLQINWATPTAGSVTTNQSLVFSPSGSWGTVTSFAVCDASGTGLGHVLWFGDLSAPRALVSGDTLTWLSGDLTLTLE